MAAALRDLPGWIRGWRNRKPASLAGVPDSGKPPPLYGLLPLLIFVGVCLPKTLQPLHYNRDGHPAAGAWLAQRLQPGDVIQDDHCWAHYYAGQVFEESKTPAVAAGYRPICYIVVTRSRDPEIDRIRTNEVARAAKIEGRLVYSWPEDRSLDAKVMIYAVPRQGSEPRP